MPTSSSSKDWTRVSPYLDQALDLATEPRNAWLARLEADQPAIALAVRKLLAERDQLNAQGFLQGSALPAIDAAASLSGTKIGGYTIDRLLGRGGMGEVWLASRSDGRFEGQCAVKFIDSAVNDSKLLERFSREGRILGRLVHPNIARLLDAGTTEDGRHYLALEYVDGERIDQYCDARSLGVDDRVRLFVDVVSAVSHAHSCLVIHRDIKPTNVFVSREGVVKLLDFGISKLITAEQPLDGDSVTQLDDAVLTPEYAAPEQLLGDAPCTATDVYQLGMLLYVLLTGRHPITASGSRAERIKAALEGQILRASEVTSAPLRKKLRGDLDAILEKALRKDPKERYATAAALREDLLRYLNREGVQAREGAALYLARKFIGRHRAGVLAAAVVVITLIGAFISTTLQLVETRKQRELALSSARRAEATKDFLQLVLSELQSRGEPLTTKSLLERSSVLLKAQYSDRPTFISEMLIELAREYGNIMELNASLRALTDARDIAQAQNDQYLVANAECAMAELRTRSGLSAEAQAHVTRGFEALDKAPPARADIRALCMYSEAYLKAFLGDRVGAIEIDRRALALLKTAGETRSTSYNYVLAGLGVALLNEGQVAEALAIFKESVDAYVRNGRGGTRMALMAEQDVSSTLYRLGEVRESYASARRLYDKFAKLTSEEDTSAAFTVNIAGIANRLALNDPTQNLLPAEVARAEKEGDLQFFRLASVELARLRLRLGAPREQIDAPLAYMENVHVAQKKEITPATRVLIETVRTELDLRDGQAQSASDRVKRLLQFLVDKDFHAPRPNYLARCSASKAALAMGDIAGAIAEARIALKLAEPMARGPDTSADVGEALFLLGRALNAQGRQGEALPLLQRALRCLRNGYGPDHPSTREIESLITQLQTTPLRSPS